MSRREAWFESQLELDPERLVFIDETGLNTKMARRTKAQRQVRKGREVYTGNRQAV